MFTAVSRTVPVVPGVMLGVETRSERSAERAPAMIDVGATVLSAVAGSVDAVVAEAEPPKMVPVADDGIETGMATEVDDALARLPVTVQVTVPDVSVQPLGSVPSVTPAGGV